MSVVSDLRPSPIAGTWYESNPQRLAYNMDEYMGQATEPGFVGNVVAVIAPHAGHRYSGPVAGHAFATIRGRAPELVVVVSPMHHPYPYPVITTAHAAYATPLGNIMVDEKTVASLDQNLNRRLGFGLTPVVRDPEHALEIELPFLQRALSGTFRLLPVMLRQQTREVSHQLGLALAETLQGRDALLVASSDLSHFYTQENASRLDAAILEQVSAFSPDGLFDVEERGKGEACGIGAMAAVMWAARELGADSSKVLRYATSGNVTGDLSRVVGYGAAVLYQSLGVV